MMFHFLPSASSDLDSRDLGEGEYLKLKVRIYIRILVIQPDYQSNRNQILAKMIHKSTSVRMHIQWIPHGMSNLSLPEILLRNFPNLFQSNPICLRITFLP